MLPVPPDVRIIVPLIMDNLLLPEQQALLTMLGVDVEWLVELVLFQWELMTTHHTQIDRVYESILADLAETTLSSEDYRDESPTSRASILANNADAFVDMATKIHDSFRPYLGTLPHGAPGYEIDSITVDSFERYFTVVQFNFMDAETP